jgi:hypothetical protein
MAEQKRTGLRVLITNNTLAVRAGTEMYVRDLALALMKRGHFPVAYSPILGSVAAELSEATVPVISDLGALGVAPDIIHGHHHLETMAALLHFPETPLSTFAMAGRLGRRRRRAFPTFGATLPSTTSAASGC